MKSVSVIGGGLAGCEAAYVIAESGIHVNLFEMKPGKHSPAHKTDDLCELVCSNSLRSDNRPFLTLHCGRSLDGEKMRPLRKFPNYGRKNGKVFLIMEK